MLRYFLLVILFYLVVTMIRRVFNAINQGLRPESEKPRTEMETKPREIYTDVKDAEFEDLEKRDGSHRDGPPGPH